MYDELTERAGLFDTVLAWSTTRFNLAAGGEAETIEGLRATASFFDVLGVRAILGRTFSERGHAVSASKPELTMSRLGRFIEAQNAPHAGYEVALTEIRTDRKRGHWIWYVFPQLAGLGVSSASQAYGIDGFAEAMEYLQHAVLRDRLLTITAAVAERLKAGTPLRTLMGSSIDTLKVVSSLTLFKAAAKHLHDREGDQANASLARSAQEVLDAAESQGYPPCRYTLARLGQLG